MNAFELCVGEKTLLQGISENRRMPIEACHPRCLSECLMCEMDCEFITVDYTPLCVQEREKKQDIIFDNVKSHFQHYYVDGEFYWCTTDRKISADAKLVENRFGLVSVPYCINVSAVFTVLCQATSARLSSSSIDHSAIVKFVGVA